MKSPPDAGPLSHNPALLIKEWSWSFSTLINQVPNELMRLSVLTHHSTSRWSFFYTFPLQGHRPAHNSVPYETHRVCEDSKGVSGNPE